jgi:hypothetical protein
MRAVSLAFRMLRRTPFVTAVAVLSLGLGIGANTAVFSLFNQILMRPLPVAAPSELVNLSLPGGRNGSTSCNNSGDCDAVFSYPMVLDLVRDQQVFPGLAPLDLQRDVAGTGRSSSMATRSRATTSTSWAYGRRLGV